MAIGRWRPSPRRQITTGTLTLQVTDPPPSFTVGCTSRVFPKHAISFVRFWDPAKTAGPLQPSKPGAVKIEGSGVELGKRPLLGGSARRSSRAIP